MKYKTVKYSVLLNKITNPDNLFSGNYTLDPYQNCDLGCSYCDSTFSDTVCIKTNSVELLEKEIKETKKGTIIIGSVVDAYQKIEKQKNITRNLLKIFKKYDFPIHILTKSDLVLRDIDLLSEFTKPQVTISLTSLDKNVTNIFEKHVPTGLERLKIMEKLNNQGITAGIAIMPVLPFIVEDEFENIINEASKHKACYVLHKHLELKGDQKNIYYNILKEFYPDLIEKYKKLYGDSYQPDENYILEIKDIIDKLCTSYKIKNKI